MAQALDTAQDIGADVINLPVDYDWLGLADEEEVLEPDLEIVDPHHHLWDRPDSRYLVPDLLRDISGGHKVTATAFVECNFAYRPDGPVELRPVGETEIVAAIAEGWATDSSPRINAGIVGYADLLRGEKVKPVLEAHIEAGRGHFRGIRQVTAWDAVASVRLVQHGPRPYMFAGMMDDSRFREGFACLEPLGLTFDSWLYHTQLPELADLARRFPATGIIINHIGGLMRAGPYKSGAEQAVADWSASIAELAKCPNVSVKLGGMGMRLLDFGFRERAKPPSSEALANAWRPFVEHCIECFGTERCMFESNFPVDKAYCTYRSAWNAYKRIASGASADEKRNLFSATATRIYRL